MLAKMFGSKSSADDGAEGDEGPSDDDVKKAKSDAFDVFFDAMHAKDKEGARKAWKTLHGDESDEDEAEADDDDAEMAPTEQ
jgi:hypothetical protein